MLERRTLSPEGEVWWDWEPVTERNLAWHKGLLALLNDPLNLVSTVTITYTDDTKAEYRLVK